MFYQILLRGLFEFRRGAIKDDVTDILEEINRRKLEHFIFFIDYVYEKYRKV